VAECTRFVLSLRQIVRGTSAVCVVTLPSHVVGADVTQRVLHACHCAFRVDAFSGTMSLLPRVPCSITRVCSPHCRADRVGGYHPPEYADFHALLSLRFALKPHALVGGHPEAAVYLLKRELHKLKIERPHLPPGTACIG
jgi:hypothetical protein